MEEEGSSSSSSSGGGGQHDVHDAAPGRVYAPGVLLLSLSVHESLQLLILEFATPFACQSSTICGVARKGVPELARSCASSGSRVAVWRCISTAVL